jgi:hypothetical protein
METSLTQAHAHCPSLPRDLSIQFPSRWHATDYDAAHGVLSITKARVCGIDKDVTKTGEDRRIVLPPRAGVRAEFRKDA